MPDATAPPPRRRVLRTAAAVLAPVVLVALAAVAGIAWLGSRSALDWAIAELTRRAGGELVVEGASGSLTSTISARRIAWRAADFSVVAENVTVAWSPAALWSQRIAIDGVGAQRVAVLIPRTSTATGLPASLALPLPVDIAHAGIARLEIGDGTTMHALSGIAFAYSGGPVSHTLSDIVLGFDAGRVSGSIGIGAAAPFGARGAFAFAGAGALARATANVNVGGSLDALDVKAALRFGDATATGSATIAPLAAAPVRTIAFDARAVDLAAVDAAWPHTAIDGTVDATANAEGRLGGRFAATNALPGPWTSARIPVVALAGRFAAAADAIELADLTLDLGTAGRASGAGRIAFDPAIVSDWRLSVRDIDLHPLHAQLVATKLSGTLRAVATGTEQRYEGDLAGRAMSLAFAATVVGDAVDVRQFRARAGGGEIAGAASYRGSGRQPFTVKATALHLDPSRFGAFPAASLDGSIAVDGTLAQPWSANVDVALAPTARFAGAPVAGTLRGAVDAQSVRDAVVDFSLAEARLTARGGFGRAGDRLDFALDAPKLDALAALAGDRLALRVGGRLSAAGQVNGTLADPGFAIDAHGEALRVGDVVLGRVDARASRTVPAAAVAGERSLSIAVTAAKLATPAGAWATAAIRVDGTPARHTAQLTVTGEGLDAEARLVGGVTGDGVGNVWRGTLVALENRGTWPLSLTAPAPVEFARGRARVDDVRIAVADGALTVGTLAWSDGRVTTRGAFGGVPLAALAQFAGTALPLRSTVVLGGEWNIVATPRLAGTVTVRRERGDLYAGTGDVRDAAEIAFGLTAADLDVRLGDDALDARLAIDAARLGTVRATLELDRDPDAAPGRIAATAPLRATLKGEIASLAVLQPFVGTSAFVDGRATLDLAAAGTRARAPLTGTLTATGLRLAAPQYGLHWTDGRINARIADDVVTLDEFSFAGGDGRFTATGTLPASRAALAADAKAVPNGARIAWRADRFRATNRPDLQFVVSGNGTLGLANGRLALAGSLAVDSGKYEFVDGRGMELSADVVVKGRPRAAESQRFSRVPLAVDLDLDLGEALTVTGKGLDTGLAGHVRVTAASGGALTGKGTIRAVNGRYYAFGQQLTIERGRLLFDGALDNPALDIVALRRNLPVEAGVEVTGSVKFPQVRLVSEPPVPDGEKLSWLVLGQGLDRTSGADTAALQAAAATLFGEGRAPIGTTIGRSIGVDEITVRGTTTTGSGTAAGGVGGHVVAVGKRLSDRLYLVYEQGVSVANNALKINYALSRNVTLRAEAGVVSGFGIYYQRSFE